MHISRLWLLVLLAGVLALPAADPPKRSQESPASARTAARLSPVQEAQERLSFQGKPIHPLLIQKLVGGLAEAAPTNAFVNLSVESKKYSPKGLLLDKTSVRYMSPEEDKGYLAYQRLGLLSNGVAVLVFSESGGGSGVFESLLAVRFETQGKPERLTIRRVGLFELGDRDERSIKVLPDRVLVSPSPGKPGKVFKFH